MLTPWNEDGTNRSILPPQQTVAVDVSHYALRTPFPHRVLSHPLGPDVAEDNVIPVAVLRNSPNSEHMSQHANTTSADMILSLIRGYPGLGRHFIRPEEGPSSRLVFLPNRDVLERFPEDVAKAQHYLRTGKVPELPDVIHTISV